MPTNRKILSQDAAVSAAADSAQGLVLHLDANDEDSIESGGANQGNGSGTWFDIANHDLNVPLADKSSNLILNLDGGIYTSGAWEDQTTNTNNASLNGNAAYNSDVRGYFTLDGTGDYLEITDNSSLNLGAATYEMWFRQPSYAADEHFFGRFEGAGARDFFVRTNGTSGGVDATFYDGSSAIAGITSSNGAYNANEWSHFAVTLAGNTSGSAVKLYVNGTLKGSTTLSGNRITDAAANLYLGILGSGFTTQYEFTGDIGTSRIYNVALSASEVAQNFRAGNFLSYSSIYSTNLEMNLDAANYTSGSTWTDSSGNGNNGTISSTPSFDKELGNHLNFSQGQTAGASTMSTNRLTVSSFAALRTNTNFAIEIWLKSSTASSDGMIWNVNDGGSGRKWSLSWNNLKFRWAVHDASGNFSSAQDVFTTNTFTTNTWLHIVATYNNGTEQKLYVNAVEEGAASNPNAGTNTTTTTQMRWGDRFDGYAVDTQIGQARYYSAALTSAQVAQNYLATKNDYPNDNNGDIQGAIFQGGSTPYYFDLDGSDDFVEITTNSSLDIGGAGYTFVGWARCEASSGTDTIISNIGSNLHGYQLAVNGTNVNLFVYAGSDPPKAQISATSSVTVDTYEHYAFTVESDSSGAAVKLYINGSLAGSTTLTDAYTGSNTNLHIGKYPFAASGRYFEGRIGLAKVFQKELSASEVLAEYNATKTTFE